MPSAINRRAGSVKIDPRRLAALRLEPSDFRTIQEVVHTQLGIELGESKRGMVEGRLRVYLLEQGYASFHDYCERALRAPTPKQMSELANRIATNHTFFYREAAHFEAYTQLVLPEWTERLSRAGSRDLRVWCAAASTGEEPYTLAFLLMEFLGPLYGSWRAGLLATDISEDALNFARQGRYTKEQVEPVPKKLRDRYFLAAGGEDVTVIDKLKKEVIYRRFNLMNTRLPFKQPFHIIFCRNVMIYFDRSDREQLVERFYDALAPGGYLLIGHAESLGQTHRFEPAGRSIYRKPEGR